MGKLMYKGVPYSATGEVEANPQGTPSDVLDSIKINGTVYGIEGGAGILVDGAINENELLYMSNEITNFTQPAVSYTAEKDCYAYVEFNGSSSTSMMPIVNGVTLITTYLTRKYLTIPLRKGDIIESRHTSDNESCYFKMYIYGRKPASEVVAPIIYSEEEREVGVWMDGKPLYQKTINIGTLTYTPDEYAPWTQIAHGINNLSQLVSFQGQVKNMDNGRMYDIPQHRLSSSQQNTICMGCDTTYIYYINSWLATTDDCFVTLQYTKTTDVAGSGEYTTLGIPSVHYSTDEQVIGTWIDGKPMYQKTLSFTNLTGSINDVPTGITNIEKVCYMEGICLQNDANGSYRALPYAIPHAYTDSNGFVFVKNNATIKFRLDANTYSELYITIRYTKTTD